VSDIGPMSESELGALEAQVRDQLAAVHDVDEPRAVPPMGARSKATTTVTFRLKVTEDAALTVVAQRMGLSRAQLLREVVSHLVRAKTAERNPTLARALDLDPADAYRACTPMPHDEA
jgi:hypothetical protein